MQRKGKWSWAHSLASKALYLWLSKWPLWLRCRPGRGLHRLGPVSLYAKLRSAFHLQLWFHRSERKAKGSFHKYLHEMNSLQTVSDIGFHWASNNIMNIWENMAIRKIYQILFKLSTTHVLNNFPPLRVKKPTPTAIKWSLHIQLKWGRSDFTWPVTSNERYSQARASEALPSASTPQECLALRFLHQSWHFPSHKWWHLLLV